MHVVIEVVLVVKVIYVLCLASSLSSFSLYAQSTVYKENTAFTLGSLRVHSRPCMGSVSLVYGPSNW